jgi:hypothetical protein
MKESKMLSFLLKENMLPYGSRKRKSTLHPHNKCEVCGEPIIKKKSERQQTKQRLKKLIGRIKNEKS